MESSSPSSSDVDDFAFRSSQEMELPSSCEKLTCGRKRRRRRSTAPPRSVIEIDDAADDSSTSSADYPIAGDESSTSSESHHGDRVGRRRAGSGKNTCAAITSRREAHHTDDDDGDDDDMEVPYALRDSDGEDGCITSRYQSRKTEPLRPGDVIQYTHPVYVAGDKRGLRITAVLSTDPNKENYPLRLANGDLLDCDHRVRRIEEYIKGQHFEHSGLARPIEKFLMEERELSGKEKEAALAGKRQTQEKIRRVLESSKRLGDLALAAASRDIETSSSSSDEEDLRTLPRGKSLRQTTSTPSSSEASLSASASFSPHASLRRKRSYSKRRGKSGELDKEKRKGALSGLPLTKTGQKKWLGAGSKSKTVSRPKRSLSDKQLSDSSSFSSDDSFPAKSATGVGEVEEYPKKTKKVMNKKRKERLGLAPSTKSVSNPSAAVRTALSVWPGKSLPATVDLVDSDSDDEGTSPTTQNRREMNSGEPKSQSTKVSSDTAEYSSSSETTGSLSCMGKQGNSKEACSLPVSVRKKCVDWLGEDTSDDTDRALYPRLGNGGAKKRTKKIEKVRGKRGKKAGQTTGASSDGTDLEMSISDLAKTSKANRSFLGRSPAPLTPQSKQTNLQGWLGTKKTNDIARSQKGRKNCQPAPATGPEMNSGKLQGSRCSQKPRVSSASRPKQNKPHGRPGAGENIGGARLSLRPKADAENRGRLTGNARPIGEMTPKINRKGNPTSRSDRSAILTQKQVPQLKQLSLSKHNSRAGGLRAAGGNKKRVGLLPNERGKDLRNGSAAFSAQEKAGRKSIDLTTDDEKPRSSPKTKTSNFPESGGLSGSGSDGATEKTNSFKRIKKKKNQQHAGRSPKQSRSHKSQKRPTPLPEGKDRDSMPDGRPGVDDQSRKRHENITDPSVGKRRRVSPPLLGHYLTKLTGRNNAISLKPHALQNRTNSRRRTATPIVPGRSLALQIVTIPKSGSGLPP